MKLDITFSPAEFGELKTRDLSRTTCVVFDILRATSSMTVALANGAKSITPVSEIEEALELKLRNPALLLAGERHGLRITSAQTGSIDFDFGNSPREFLREKVQGKEIAMTTTNGTRALNACQHAAKILVASFFNLSATVSNLKQSRPENLLLICAGTYEEASLEDTLAAGAIANGVWDLYETGHVTDAAQIARMIYHQHQNDLLHAMNFARNGRRLLAHSELGPDVPFCLQQDQYDFVAELKNGAVIRS